MMLLSSFSSRDLCFSDLMITHVFVFACVLGNLKTLPASELNRTVFVESTYTVSTFICFEQKKYIKTDKTIDQHKSN